MNGTQPNTGNANSGNSMIEQKTQIRVRYAETDQMGVVYHSHYAVFFEVGRADLIRAMGLTYRQMEENGLLMPITSLHIDYRRPALYDDLLTVTSAVTEMPSRRLAIHSKIHNEAGDLLVTGKVELAFLDKSTGKTVSAPPFFTEMLQNHWPLNA